MPMALRVRTWGWVGGWWWGGCELEVLRCRGVAQRARLPPRALGCRAAARLSRGGRAKRGSSAGQPPVKPRTVIARFVRWISGIEVGSISFL
jgi:hypothetical protein